MTLEQILAKCEPQPSGCLLFAPERRIASRYGSVYINGKPTPTHRAVWSLTHGPIPAGMCVCHRCDVPRCVNIDHLFLGTHQENMADMMAKGRKRGLAGEDNPTHRLTREDVLKIRASTETHGAVAKAFGIARDTVRKIRYGVAWKSVPIEVAA